MPITLNIGLSRKVGEANFGSRGASVNLQIEADTSLAADPAKFQQRIRQLFGLVRTSLAEELNGGCNGHANNGGDTKGGAQANGNHKPSTPPRPATQSQVKAIHAIAKDKRVDVKKLLRNFYRVDRPEELSIKDASKFIDELKRGDVS